MAASSSSFVPQRVTHVAAATVRVRFSTEPKLGAGTASDDALTPVNYLFSGPNSVIATRVLEVFGDPLSVDVFVTAPLSPGSWTLTVASTVRSDENVLVSTPRSIVFAVSVSVGLDVVSGGAITDTTAMTISKHLPRSFAGRAWDAIVAALAYGDQINIDNAAAAFDQLFISSASGKYLESRASEVGIRKPADVGLSDETFRALTIKTSSDRVTAHSQWEILEIFYGTDSVRARLDSALNEPFVLEAGQTLKISDGQDELEVVFASADFSNIGAALAAEVVATIVRQARAADLKVFALVLVDPLTLTNKVRLYSSALGLGSTLTVTGGVAQNGLRFPTRLLGSTATFAEPTITNIANQTVTSTVAFTFTPAVTNTAAFSLVWSVVGSLPAGLSINPATGVISGTPTGTVAAVVSVSLRITYVSGVSNSNTFTITLLTPFVEEFETADGW